MPEKPDSLHTIGLEIEGPILKGARLSLIKDKPIINELFEQAHSDIVNQLYIENADHALLITAVNPNDVLVRPLEIKLKKEKDIDSTLSFQAEPLLPYPLENGVLDRVIVGPVNEGTLLTLFAVRKDHLKQHLESWEQVSIDPEVVTCVPSALATFANFYHPSENPLIVLHLGYATTSCLLVHEGKLLAALSVPNGVNKLLEVDPQAASIDYATIENPALHATKEILRLDATRLIYALSKQSKGKEANEILLTGEGAAWCHLGETIVQGLNKTLIIPLGDDKYTSIDLQRYAVSIGSALSALPKTGHLLNFRQEEFSYANPWKRYKKPLAMYMALCLAFAGALFLFGNAYIKYREDELKQSYSDLLVTMHKPYNAFEEEFEKKFPPSTPREEGQTLALIDMTRDDLTERLRFLEKELQSTPDSFPLLPNTPRVSDVLAWLSKHPSLVNKDKEAAPIQIENLNYSMVKRPEQTKKQEKYQVKVELEFSSPTPKQAREFHDALIAPNDFVDPKGEVKWSSNRGKYRTSFYLKDRTVYPAPS
jgi:type IV pilus assembly protein PilM